jgi:hypothetical protein
MEPTRPALKTLRTRRRVGPDLQSGTYRVPQIAARWTTIAALWAEVDDVVVGLEQLLQDHRHVSVGLAGSARLPPARPTAFVTSVQ